MHYDPNSSLIICLGNLEVSVDREDLLKINFYKWRTYKYRNEFKIVTTTKVDGKWKTLSLGRLIMNPPKDQIVCFVNPNEKLDFRKCNLLISQKNQLKYHRLPPNVPKTSRLVGVSFCKSLKKWRATITVNYQSIYLGCFNDEKSAHAAYLEAKSKIKDLKKQGSTAVPIDNLTL